LTSRGPGRGVEIVVGEGETDDRDEAILKVLESSSEPLGVSEIARRTGFNKSLVWRKLKKLVSRGLVEKLVVNGRPVYRVRKRNS
jgi:predicted transcriptional regulator